MSLEELLSNNEINKYFYDQLSRNSNYLPEELQQEYIENAKAMSAQGVDSHNEQKIFFYIMTHAAEIAMDLAERGTIKSNTFSQLYADMYTNRHKNPIDNLLNFYHAVGASLGRLGIPLKKTFKSQAYPQGWFGNVLLPPYDINRWMRATGDIYSRVKSGEDEAQAFNLITSNWDKMEKMDYKNWLKFYQEGANLKYKTASPGYQSDFGFYLPNPIEYSALKAKLPNPINPQEKEDIENVQPAPKPKDDLNSVKDKIEGHRSRLLGRLNSAEKLLCSTEGQFFAGEDQETMLRLLQDLKRKIQTANKINVNSALFEDLIYRAAYQSELSGCQKFSKLLHKVAQAQETASEGEAAPPDLLADLGEPTPPADLGEGTAPMESLPGENAAIPEAESTTLTPTQQSFKTFFNLLESGSTDTDELEADDALLTVSSDYEPEVIVVEAQEAPVQEAVPEPVANQPGEESVVEVAEPDDHVTDAIEMALKNVSINDAISKLEGLSGLYKRREISKEIFIVDLMLNQLGIGSFFPSLAEAEKSILESNQYVSTRIDDILAKLRGGINIENSDKFVKQENPDAPMTPLQQNLQEQEDQEKAKKQRRREIEDAKNSGPAQAPAAEQVAQAPAPQVEQPQQQIPRPE